MPPALSLVLTALWATKGTADPHLLRTRRQLQALQSRLDRGEQVDTPELARLLTTAALTSTKSGRVLSPAFSLRPTKSRQTRRYQRDVLRSELYPALPMLMLQHAADHDGDRVYSALCDELVYSLCRWASSAQGSATALLTEPAWQADVLELFTTRQLAQAAMSGDGEPWWTTYGDRDGYPRRGYINRSGGRMRYAVSENELEALADLLSQVFLPGEPTAPDMLFDLLARSLDEPAIVPLKVVRACLR